MTSQRRISDDAADLSYSQRLNNALRAAKILTGALDEELGISKAKTKQVRLTVDKDANRTELLSTLDDRYRKSAEALPVDTPMEAQLNDIERATGDLALVLLTRIHFCLIEKKQDSTARVAVNEGTSRLMTASEDVGLGVKDVKLIATLQALVSRWVFATRIKAYDVALQLLRPQLYNKTTPANSQISDKQRFEEVEDLSKEQLDRLRLDFAQSRGALAEALDRWSTVLSTRDGQSFAASTDVATVLIRLGVVDFVCALLRIGFGPSSLADTAITSAKDKPQLQATQRITQVLSFLSTSSAMSTLSAAMTAISGDKSMGTPVFVRTVASRLLTAQLLRPDGVRSLLMSTFGGSSSEATDESVPQGGESLKKFEQVARLLMTPPKNMPVDVYMSIILPNLVNILISQPGSATTPPPPEQLRAAGFTLTRIAEKQTALFRNFMAENVNATLNPEAPSSAGEVVASKDLDRSLSILSAFLLFSEPSPDLYMTLFGPILPQLLSLFDFLGRTGKIGGKGKVKSLDAGTKLDSLKKEIEGFLHTWTRLVDATTGSKALIEAIRSAERGIGSQGPMGEEAGAETVYWKEDSHGVAIWFGKPPQESIADLASLIGGLNFSTLAQKISSGQLDESGDVPVLPANLSASLGLRPDPALIAALLKKANRQDLAQLLLPLVLDTYMSNKTAVKSNMLAQSQVELAETRSVLFLQLLLQLFDAFGSGLLLGSKPTTLAFINFALSTPPAPLQAKTEESQPGSIPFIPATSGKSSSLFNIATKSSQDEKPVSLEEAEEATEEDEDMIKTALSLLLALLEGDTEMSTETEPMLSVIESKIEALLDSHDAEIRSVGKEAKLVLLARKTAARMPKADTLPHQTNNSSQKFKQAHETYQEALTLLQDPILPIRAHGLVLLRKLVSDNKTEGGQAEHLDPALLPAILDIFLQAVQDEESYLYLNAVQGLGALASSGGRDAISRLVGVYVGRDDRLTSVTMPTREVEKRLRVGEALLQVIQRSGDALRASLSTLVSPILSSLGDRSLPTVLRSSFLSILGTAVEAVPLAMATIGYAAKIADVCMDILRIETVHRPATKREPVKMKVQNVEQSVEDDELMQQRDAEQLLLDSATTTDTKVAHLRRAALLAIILLVRGTRHQLEDLSEQRPAEKLSALRMPGGNSLPRIVDLSAEDQGPTESRLKQSELLFPLDKMAKLKELAAFVAAKDNDSFVRGQAQDCITEVDELTAQLIASGIGM